MAGGLVRLFFDKKRKITEEKRKDAVDRGILYTSGLIAGEGLVGVLLAILAIIPIGKGSLGDLLNLSQYLEGIPYIGAIQACGCGRGIRAADFQPAQRLSVVSGKEGRQAVTNTQKGFGA